MPRPPLRASATLFVALMFLAACGGSDGGGGTPPTATPTTGTFAESPVNGLHYTSPPSNLAGGFTANGGQYHCIPGDTVTFDLGGRTIGTGQPCGPLVTVVSVFGATSTADTRVRNLSQLLLTLGGIPTGQNPIQLPATIPAGLPNPLDFSDPNFTTVLQAGLPGATLVTKAQASAYLHTSFKTVSVAAVNDEMVTSNPAGIACTAGDCSSNLITRTADTLTATGMGFTGWSGDGCSGTGTCQTMLEGITAVRALVQAVLPSATTVDTQAVALTAQILGGGDQTKPALRQALLASGFAIQAPDGSLTQPTRAPSQGMLFTQWDVDVMALGANNGGFITLSDYAAAFQMAFPDLESSQITAKILAGIRDSAQAHQPTVRLWARLIVGLGLQAELPYNLLDPNVDPTQVDLSPIQLGLLTPRLLGDVMSLVGGTVARNPSALNARIASNAVSTFQLGIPTALNLADSAPPCTFTNIEQTILDVAAKAETKAFKAFINYLSEKGVGGAGTIGKVLGPVNAVLTYAKLLASLLAFNEDFTADLTQLKRTQSTQTGGEQMNITVTVKFDNGNAQILNCLRQVGNLAGIDFKLTPTGPIKNAEIKWYLLAGDTNGNTGTLGYLRWAKGNIPNESRFTNDNGQDTITIEGAPQQKMLLNPVQDSVTKPGKVHAKINLKSANIVQDIMSAIGGLVSLPVEMAYRTGLGFERSFSFPVIDWLDCGAASNNASNNLGKVVLGQVVRAANVCSDTWVGTTSSGDAAYGPNQTQASLTLKFDDRVTGTAPGQVFYYAVGTVKVKTPALENIGCVLSTTEIVIDRDTGSNTPGHGDESNQFEVNYGNDPPTAGGAGLVGVTQTVVCPGAPTQTLRIVYPFYNQGHDVPLSADRQSFGDTNLPFYSFQFKRP